MSTNMVSSLDSSSSVESFSTNNSKKNDPAAAEEEYYNPLIPTKLHQQAPLSVGELKMQWLRKNVLANKKQYCSSRNLKTVSITWNVNGREPQEDLSQLFPEGPCDILVVGLQEVDRRAEAYMYNVNVREQIWTNEISASISRKYPSETFFKVASKALVGLYISVFIKEEYFEFVSRISTSSAPCGIMGIVGNKGAVGVRFKLYDDYICYINCHLAAHPNQILRRNQDLSDLHKRIVFPLHRSSTKSRKSKHEKYTDKYWSIKGFCGVNDCDILVWMGDFNYRVDMDTQLARMFVQHGQYTTVLAKDQMQIEKESGQEYLCQYSEATIDFAPSYSFDTGTDLYDTSEKQRVPSWCDRIIWREKDPLSPFLYDCLFQFKSSDHKPVRLISDLDVSEVIGEKFDKCYFESLKQLDAFENAAIPDTEISRNVIDVGMLAYTHSSCESFKLFNKGIVMAQYRFVFHEDIRLKMPSWIKIEPVQGLIAPGESENINLNFVYDNFVAMNVPKQHEVLEHVLVLHIEGGRDHFISVSFSCQETDFGKKLEDLKFHRVILDRKTPDLLFKVPTVLWRLIDFLIDQPNSLITPNLFLLSGPKVLNDEIQNALDLHEPFPESINCESGYHSVAETILRFFKALPDSLIPSLFFEKCLLSSKSSASSLQALNEIPEMNFLVLEYFLRFLRDILLERNSSIPKNSLCQTIGVSLLRPLLDRELSKKDLRDIELFFYHFLYKH